MRHALPVLCLVGLTAACLGPRPWWEKELRAWEGASVSELMTAWGAPDRTVTDEAGRPTLVYQSTAVRDRREEILRDPGQALGKQLPDQGVDPIEDLDCSMYFETEDEFVVETRYEGAGCQVVPRDPARR